MNIKKIRPEFKNVVRRFDSGNSHLDSFLKSSFAYDDSFGKTYLFLTDDEKSVIGYYNIGMGSIEQNDNAIRRKLGGAVHINCFAIDKMYQDQIVIADEEMGNIHLSDLMLRDCLNRIYKVREEHVGVMFVTLCSTEEGEFFYRRNDFLFLDNDMSFAKEDGEEGCAQMYLPLDYLEM